MRNLPEKHQTLLFSATMPVEIEGLAQVSIESMSSISKEGISSTVGYMMYAI